GDVDEFDAVIERDLSILGGGDALDGERDLELRLDALDGFPIERFLKVPSARATAAAGDVALGDVAFAPAVMRGVDGQAERRVFVGDGARNKIIDPGGVATHVELKDAQGIRRGLSDPFEARIAHRRQHVGDAEFRRGFGDGSGAFGMKALKRTDWAEQNGQLELAAENFSRG